MKRCSMSFVLREVQINTITRNHNSPNQMVKIKKRWMISAADEDVEQ